MISCENKTIKQDNLSFSLTLWNICAKMSVNIYSRARTGFVRFLDILRFMLHKNWLCMNLNFNQTLPNLSKCNVTSHNINQNLCATRSQKWRESDVSEKRSGHHLNKIYFLYGSNAPVLRKTIKNLYIKNQVKRWNFWVNLGLWFLYSPKFCVIRSWESMEADDA